MTRRLPRSSATGFTLIEMIVVVFLLALAMLGILAVFDASARINKSEQDVADAQGSVRYGIYQMARAIRVAGSGGIFIEQAVLNHPDSALLGVSVTSANGYDNVTGATVDDINTGISVPVRDGTDMIEIRGVINSPLLSFDHNRNMCPNCTAASFNNITIAVPALTAVDANNQQHYNDDATNRPQFAAIDTYTATASGARPMFVLVTANDEIHPGAASVSAFSQYPQSTYDVGLLTKPTAAGSFLNIDFTDVRAKKLNAELPSAGAVNPSPIVSMRRIGILDDLIYFIDNTDPLHPGLAQGTRRGDAFDIVRLADDVEDMQIAYGVDLDGNGALNRKNTASAGDLDANVSNVLDKDEWAPNVPGEAVFIDKDFQSDSPFVAAHGPTTAHFPRLHGVMVSLVANSKDPDPTYKSPAAHGIVVMNTPLTGSFPTAAQYTGVPTYRRRLQTMKINLRNYGFSG